MATGDLIGLLCGVALLLFAELAARAAARSLGEDLWLKEPTMQRKDDQMRALARRTRRRSPRCATPHADVDVIYVGSSIMMCAVDPGVVEREFQITGYNAGLFRGLASYNAAWARCFALRRLRTRILVIEASLPTLNDHAVGVVLRASDFYQTPYFTTRRRLRWVYELGHYFRMLRVLPRLMARPYAKAVIVQMFRKGRGLSWRLPTQDEGILGGLGESVEHDRRTSFHLGPRLRQLLDDSVVDFSTGGAEWTALRELVQHARRQGMLTLLLAPPLSSTFAHDILPGGQDASAALWARIEQLALRDGIDWLRPTVQLDQEDFSDPVHLNGRGKAAYSRAVGEALLSKLQSLS